MHTHTPAYTGIPAAHTCLFLPCKFAFLPGVRDPMNAIVTTYIVTDAELMSRNHVVDIVTCQLYGEGWKYTPLCTRFDRHTRHMSSTSFYTSIRQVLRATRYCIWVFFHTYPHAHRTLVKCDMLYTNVCTRVRGVHVLFI